jgi:hypothetical protein
VDSLWRLPLVVTMGALILVPLVRLADPESHRLLVRAWERLSGPLRPGSVEPSPPA